MMKVYKQQLPSLGGYICHGSDVNLARVEQFIQVSELPLLPRRSNLLN